MILSLWKQEQCLVEFATESGYYGSLLIEDLRETSIVFNQIGTGLRIEVAYNQIQGIGKMFTREYLREQLFPNGEETILHFIPDEE